MNARNVLLGILLIAVVVLGLWIAGPSAEATASALSARSSGWLGARSYLERRGSRVTLSDQPLSRLFQRESAGTASVWVISFPFQRHLADEDLKAIQDHLHAGGTVLLAYSKSLEQSQEERVFANLRLSVRAARDSPPLVPWQWWAYQKTAWTLTPGDGWATAADDPPAKLALPALRQLPRIPPDADVSVLYEVEVDGDAHPVVFSYPLQSGRVVALPAVLLSNAYLLEEGHADLLENLRLWLGESWTFDEYHHGLVSAELTQGRSRVFAWDFFMVHIVLFYVLALLALTRRFGPAWREGEVVAGSTASFLRNLGALHLDLRHHQAAARLLVDRRRQLDPSLPEISVPEISTDARLVEFARAPFTPQEKAR